MSRIALLSDMFQAKNKQMFFSHSLPHLSFIIAMSSWMPMSVDFSHYLGVHQQGFQWFSAIMNGAYCSSIIIYGVLLEMIVYRVLCNHRMK
jgi:hypothetical protein